MGPLSGTAVGTLAALAMILCSAGAAAQERPAATQADVQPPKAPAPPLFPRHRRGIYRNAQGIEVIDATPQSPPLEIDDPGVPDNGGYEINFTAHTDYAKAAQRIDLLRVDANYGLLPVIAGYQLPTQIKFEFPVAAARQSGNPFETGLGEVIFGLKFKFYHDEHRGISVSIYPQIAFAAPGGVRKRLADEGQTLILPLLVAREFHECTVVVNGAFEKPLHDPDREAAIQFGGAFGRALTRKTAAMIELRSESTVDLERDRLLFVNAGVMYGVGSTVIYANLGRSLFADDGLGHTYAGVGLKVLIAPKRKASGP